MTGTDPFVMNIDATMTSNLGPAPISSGIVVVTTSEVAMSNASTPGEVAYIGSQPIPMTEGTALWEYEGTYQLTGNPEGIISCNTVIAGQYTMDVDAGLLSGVMTANCIPTISEWGLIVMTVLCLTAGTIMYGRRRRPAAAR